MKENSMIGIDDFSERPELDIILNKLRKAEKNGEAYNFFGQKAYGIISKEVLPKLGELKDTVEIYYFRLRCNGQLDIITACERKLLLIIRKNTAEMSGQQAYLRRCPWYNYIMSGFPIFSEGITQEIKKALEIRES